ncbi:Hypothetical predicted protein [Lecanosticta acicola]|uniref:Uncharacterized protein n=1 Tax=Lecanosticta acicola TaxID=111012 RepID=A0AAI9E873_9PEZI|nr:Hypothetical predicted protein [Lecanosticta acicola]
MASQSSTGASRKRKQPSPTLRANKRRRQQQPVARARVARARCPRRREPYSVLGLDFEDVVNLPEWQQHAAINRAVGAATCSVPSGADEDPLSPFHQRISEIADARMILEDERMRSRLNACLSNLYLGTVLNAARILGIYNPLADEDETKGVNKLGQEEWAAYGKLGGVVAEYINHASKHLLDTLDERRASPPDSPGDSAYWSVE